jgi:hypothetical protein
MLWKRRLATMAKFEVRVRVGSSDGLSERFVDKSLEGAETQAREWLARLGYTEAEAPEVRRYFIDECGGKFRIDLACDPASRRQELLAG